jgi:hypothetical protein
MSNEPLSSEDPAPAMRRAILVYEGVTTFFDTNGRKSTLQVGSSPPSIKREARSKSPMIIDWMFDAGHIDNYTVTVAVGESPTDVIGRLHYSGATDKWEVVVNERAYGPRLGLEPRGHHRLNPSEVVPLLARIDAFVRAHEPKP